MTDFTMTAGDDKWLALTVVDESGAAIDLTGLQAAVWTLARSAETAAIVTHDLDDGRVVIVDLTIGRLNVMIDSADTADLRGDVYHRTRVTDATGKTGTVDSGVITLEPAP